MTDAFFRTLARAAAASYPGGDRYARHFAYGKLVGDPVFAHLLRERLIPERTSVLELGSGQGLLAALLFAARDFHHRGTWPAGLKPPPDPARFTGIDLLPRDVERARAMAKHWAATGATGPTFLAGDLRTAGFAQSDIVVAIDVLHYLDYAAQAEVLGRVRAALAPRGVLLLRVGDASGSLRFRASALADRLAMRLRGLRLPRLWCRPAAAWRAELEALGFKVESTRPMSAGTPFANVLLVASYDSSCRDA